MATKYEIKGTTDDVTTCAFGHTGLKKTVVLWTLDADGNREDVIYVGTDCAAKLLRTTETKVRNAAAGADTQHAQDVTRAQEWINIYGPVEGDVRATAEVFFGRNPHMRNRCKASVAVAEMLDWARSVISVAAVA